MEADWTPEAVARRFKLSAATLDRLALHVDILMTWQAKINLVAASTLAQVWKRHVADSLQLLGHLPPGRGGIADLGSGAGFPGLSLCIATGRQAHLIESNGKKAAFLAEVIRRTGAPAQVHRSRIEAFDAAGLAEPPAAVTARALAPLPLLIELSEPFLTRGAVGLYLKGADVEEELTESAKSWTIDMERHPSCTDPAGAVLVVKGVTRGRI